MKESKAIYVTKYKIREENNQDPIKLNRTSEHLYTTELSSYERDAYSVGCQCDSKRGDMICTCRNLATQRKRREVKQIYTYHGSRSFTDIGVGSVKALQRKKVKRIYLPETDNRGVGSSVLSSFISKKSKQYKNASYYDHKRTSSKCVGGIIENNPVSILSVKLSPIVQTKSATTGPQIPFENKNIGNNTTEKKVASITTQVENDSDKAEIDFKLKKDKTTEALPAPVKKVSAQTQKYKNSQEILNIAKENKTEKKDFSSDSLVQHVHNLETPSQDKRSCTSTDLMENKLEREYRKIFSTKSKEAKPSNDKPVEDFKSASLLRRRFEALRRGLGKKEETKKSFLLETNNSSPRVSEISHKDASVTSDPPSLESRSYSNLKTYSPYQPREEQSKYYDYRDSYKKPRDSFHPRTEEVDSESQGVKGMFKLWGKKFNFEEDSYKRRPTPKPSMVVNIKPEKTKAKTVAKTETEEKKEGRKFFFFKKRSKDKTKQTYKTKKGFTTGRCEIKDGLMIQIGAANSPIEEREHMKVPEELDEILRKPWLQKFLTPNIDSRNSVNVRWNNKTYYTTSSSTVFELMDTVYKASGLVFKSQSEITTGESSYYKSYTKQRVNFVQDIEAWMIAKTFTDRPKELPIIIRSKSNYNITDDMEVTISNQKWYIDKSKAFSHNIEVVLHSKDIVKLKNKVSSEYLRIDIPKGFFDSSTDESCKYNNNHTSDEEVYKIVEYDTGSDLRKASKGLDTGDHMSKVKVTVSIKDSKDLESNILQTVIRKSKIEVNKELEPKILETVIKQPPVHRDVVIQGSTVCIPKRCDVIGVGIITQRDLRDIRKPILKIQADVSDEDSDDTPETYQKKCEFAESFLQDYYRNWMPLGIDLFSWCVSDSHIGICSENSRISFNNQGDGSKSCPNIYDDFQTATVLNSSCDTCCSQCNNKNDSQKANDTLSSKFFKKFVRKQPSKSEPIVGDNSGKRVLPKDSLEVFKKRKLYAASNKGNWADSNERPYSVPSIESKGAQNTLIDYPKVKKACCKPPPPKPKKGTCKKHVSMPDCETMKELLAKQLQDELPSGILAFKGSTGCELCKRKGHKCPKHAVVQETPTSQLLPAPCKETCEKEKNPPCSDPKMFQSPTPSPPPTPPLPLIGPCESCLKNLLPKNLFSCSPPPEKLKKPRARSPCKTCSHKSRLKKYSASSPPSDKQSPATSNRSSPPLSGEPSPISSPKSKFNPCPILTTNKPRTPSPTPSDTVSSTRVPCKKRTSSPPKTKKKCSQNVSKKLSPCPKSGKNKKSDSSGSNTPSLAPSPPRSPIHERVSPCKLPPCNKIKIPKKCNTPPCKKPSPSSGNRNTSEEYLYPTKNQVSNQPSQKKWASPPPNAYGKSQKNEKCKKDCSLVPKLSSQSIAPKKESDCAINCANRKRLQELPPGYPMESHPEPVQPSKDCPNADCSKIKISGIFLKMKPSKKKTCAKECSAWESGKEDYGNGVVRLNSHERLTIRTKACTPSTEEIREGMNIKVQDEDGKTLYERKDYRKYPTNRPSVLQDMYKDSNVNRMTTPITVKNIMSEAQTHEIGEVKEEKSEISLANLIEIQFKLRVTQGDKTTEINIANDETKKQNKENEMSESPEIYHVKNEVEENGEYIDPKNDINIKIVIKNYKHKSEAKKCTEKYNDEFSKQISNKFNTVSTGYSDVIDEQSADNVFSVHRATVNLTSSVDKSKIEGKPSEEVMSQQLTDPEPINLIVSSNNTEHYVTDQSESKTEGNADAKSISSKKDSESKNILSDDQYQYDTSKTRDSTDIDEQMVTELRTCSYESTNKVHNKKEKKELLKKLLEKAHATKTKTKMKHLREMLKIILTSDSSENDEMTVTSNELAKDVTYASLKPNYFRDTDSMNNYYKIDSTIPSVIESNMRSTNVLYPTQENNSQCSKTSEALSSENDIENETHGCMCNKFAEKLNLCQTGNAGCCCRKANTNNEETYCDLRNEEDLFLLNYRTEYVDVETQNSKDLTSKVNSTNISLHNDIQSNVIQKSLHILAHMKESSPKLKHNEKKSKIVVNEIFCPHKIHRDCEMKKITRNTILGISDDDKIVILSTMKVPKDINLKKKESLCEIQKHKDKSKVINPVHILQSYETKKAVLEIYAEKTVSQRRERIVAKLPKFVYEKESEICRHYQDIASNSYKSVCRRNIDMSVKR